jgi:DNA recombination protein RmuC
LHYQEQKVNAELMNLLLAAVLLALGLVLVLLILQFRKLSDLSRKETDLAPVLNNLGAIQKGQEQVERTVCDEISRNRLEHSAQSQALRGEVVTALTGLGDSVSTKVEGLTRSNDQKLELLRSAMEQRLDAFSTESGRKTDSLNHSVAASSGKLQDAVSVKLAEFRNSLEGTVRETHQLQREQTETISATIQSLQSSVDERQSRLQTVIDTKLLIIGQQTGQKLTEVESALRSQAHQLREETGKAFKSLGDSILTTLTGISHLQKNELQDLKTTVDGRLATIQSENEKKLEQMRQTVDEKLQGTLEARLGESFKQVSDRLEQVYKGLGEMQTLAAGVGDLKRVLTNVKTRGTWGEIQLGALLEQMLAPDQYGQNVATSGTGERVEYAIKLPGRGSNGTPVWLPIDAKFPVEDYQRLVEASERGDVDAFEKASRQLEATLKFCAKNLSDKYIAPPATTDFGILFLSTEGLYAEAMRRAGLAEFIQREYRIVLSGPSTLAALLNSFQMGFRTLAIQQRSSEVWELLGTVKSEFGKYADVLAKVKKKLTEAQNTIDTAETRTRAIHRKLRDVESTDMAGLIEDESPEEDADEAHLLVGAGEDV